MYSSQAAAAGLISSNAEVAKSFIAAIRHSSGPILGVALSNHSTTTASIAGLSGATFTFIDMEHSPLSVSITTSMVHAVVSASRGRCFPLVRLPSHGVEWIKWALDCGAAGIVVPMVDNEAQMRAIIDKALYPPAGRRSFGPSLAVFGDPEGPDRGVAAYLEKASRGDIAILLMIESKEGLENVEAIMSVQGVSGVFVGPVDLRMALGLPGGQDGGEPEFEQAIKKIMSAAKKLNKVVGSIAMGEMVTKKRTEDGMDFLVATADTGVLSSGFVRDLAISKLASTVVVKQTQGSNAHNLLSLCSSLMSTLLGSSCSSREALT